MVNKLKYCVVNNEEGCGGRESKLNNLSLMTQSQSFTDGETRVFCPILKSSESFLNLDISTQSVNASNKLIIFFTITTTVELRRKLYYIIVDVEYFEDLL